MKIWKIILCCTLFFPLSGFSQQRIISLAPNLTEILFAVGAGNEMVGTSAYSNYPQQAKKIPIVANAGQLNIEAIIAAKPTLVIAWHGGNSQIQLNELKKFSIPVYSFSFKKISDITFAMKQIGKLTHHQSQAIQQINLFNKQLKQLQQQKKDNSKPLTVFYLLWQNPLITIGNSTLINQAIMFCGGKNIFSDINNSAPTVNIATVLQRNPAIIINGSGSQNWKNYWQQWSILAAVKNKRLYSINPDLLQRAGPRFILGMVELCGDIRNTLSQPLRTGLS